jgi:hypothetical protein
MTKLFPSQFLNWGRMFKTGYSHTKMELMKQNQTEVTATMNNFHRQIAV